MRPVLPFPERERRPVAGVWGLILPAIAWFLIAAFFLGLGLGVRHAVRLHGDRVEATSR